jgi:hypothetical protein
MLVNTPTLFSNEIGSKIFNNRETETILRGDKPQRMQSIDVAPIVKAIENNQQSINFDKRGIFTEARRGAGLTKFIGDKYRN